MSLLKQLLRFMAGYGLFAVGLGCLVPMLAILISIPQSNAFIDCGVILLFANLAFASVISGMFVLEHLSLKVLTRAGWILHFGIFNLMVGIALGMAYSTSLAPYLAGSVRVVAVLVLLPAFCLGWFVLSRFGIRIYREPEGTDKSGAD